jgi:hypothetical protein
MRLPRNGSHGNTSSGFGPGERKQGCAGKQLAEHLNSATDRWNDESRHCNRKARDMLLKLYLYFPRSRLRARNGKLQV